ncbi:hypothetical protein QUG98_00525 [Curtobacterium sp. RHCJP20]|uniref:Uncharacterized protein n=1 Tax=Curtobacterium subtropicum TaxID=3055138 RepID=A0ABT7TBG8_9MICO|nr:hypothetical protein [Curtobacterium subtropicum]MDM7886927.1 hypothetical protein [Curtobacterium subtropicum]
MQDQENRPYRPDDSDHPAIVRLQAELDAARDGIGVLGELEADRRERVVAELLSAVPDVASRAAYEAGADRAVATIRRFEERRAVDHESAPALWDRLVLTAFEAAAAAEPTERDPASARRGATAVPVGAVSDARA